VPSEIADACLWGTVLDASGTLLDEQVREVVAAREDWMGCRRATAVLTPQSVNAYVPSHVYLVYGVLA
jgi:hypothetical protein